LAKRFEYTTTALRYTAKFPVLTYVGIQANFWIIANILLVVILSLQSKYFQQVFGVAVNGRLTPVILIAIVLGILYGVILGLTGFYLDRQVFRKMPLGKVIVLKSLGSLALLVFLLWLTRLILSDQFIWRTVYPSRPDLNDSSLRYLFYLLVVYYFFMTLVISFINQVNRKYGPGVLVPLLFGRYRNPREEERIFMFMDLKSSTAIAEKLGHLNYSSFIRDCFMDINEVLMPSHAQVYQYVGDEIVVTWQEDEGTRKHFCISFYFACKDQFTRKSDYYLKNYGVVPHFKAGLHGGLVTAVEIGEVKRDIAYHGDTLNTAARIRSICSEYDKDFLISETLLSKMKLDESIRTESLGPVQLRGKAIKVGVVSLTSE
jgi:adenylate cyclase